MLVVNGGGTLDNPNGFAVTGTLYSALGIVFTLAVGFYWRAELWDRAAPVNER